MSDELKPKEKEILNALYVTYKKNASLYLDLAHAFPDWHPDEIKYWVYSLQEIKLLHYLGTQDGIHLLCRITEHGIEVLNESISFFEKLGHNKKTFAYAAGILLVAAVIGFNSLGISSDSFMGSITGTGLTDKTKTILTEWLEGAEQENSDNYTFSLLDKEGTRRSYLVECKDAAKGVCKYNIVFVEVDEKDGKVTNVELPLEQKGSI